MRPVLEHAFVDALGLPQVGAGVIGDAAIENMMVRALDHVDGVDLHVAEMLDRRRNRPGAAAERCRRIEPLAAQPDLAGLGLAQGTGRNCAGHRAAI